jgi:flagellar biosynthesis protein FlhF
LLKRYLVSSMSSALEKVRLEMGPDAVVLESRQIRTGFLWIKPLIEVVASDETVGGSMRARRPLSPTMTGLATHAETPATAPRELAPALAAPPLEVAAAPAAPADGTMAWPTLMNRLNTAADASPLRPLWTALQSQEVDSQLALEVIMAAATEVDPASWSSQTVANEVLVTQIERRVPTTGPIALEDDRPTIMAIVGPTGVGKTTTIAKLATSARTQGFRVALTTFDTHRAGAVEQLRSYADILDVPIHVAYTPEELARTIQSLKDVDLVLIDTPGCGGKNRALLEELQRCFSPFKECEVHLALSCDTQLPDMLETTRAFDGLGLTGVILTKVDEASCLGPALSLVHQSGKPLSYLTTGQSIPADVEVATSRRFAELLVARQAAA